MEAKGTKRVFIAFNLPGEVREKIGSLIDRLSSRTDAARWVRPETVHLTLHFLGSLGGGEIEWVKAGMAAESGSVGGIKFVFDRPSAFPNIRRPRVIVIGGREIGGTRAVDFQRRLGNELRRIGLEIDSRPWAPHLTLGRARERKAAEFPDFEPIEFGVTTFELMESLLTPGGADYQLLSGFRL